MQMIQPSNTKTLLNSSKTLSCKKRAYSLPKTQPTKGSSTHKTILNENNNHVQIGSEFEVSEFRGVDSMMYTHRMNIDFGHLEIPSWMHSSLTKQMDVNADQKETERIVICQKFQDSKQIMKAEEIEKREIKTEIKKEKKSKSFIKLIKQTAADDQVQIQSCEQPFNPYAKITLNQNQAQNQHFQQTQNESPLNEFQLKSLPVQSQEKTPISSNYSSTSKALTQLIQAQKKMQTKRLKKVVAAKDKQLTQLKNVPETSEATFRYEESYERQKTTRRVPHCRIIRSYVAGSKMQVKIINYPDSSEYMKLCGLTK